MTLPKMYAWLANETGPRILTTALPLVGTAEKPGPGNNPSIIQWAKDTNQKGYVADSIAWCGLFMAYVALQSGWGPLPVNPLGARNWLTWGNEAKTPMLGDVLVFWRGSKKGFQGHVGLYVGEDKTHYHVLGGNQANTVSFKRIARGRLLGARRCKWQINQPSNVRIVQLAAVGSVTTNEA